MRYVSSSLSISKFPVSVSRCFWIQCINSHFRSYSGCIDNREVDVAVLVDVTDQTVDQFNFYMLYFSYWFNEDLLTSNTNIHYIYFTDEVEYAGKTPYDHFGFEVDSDGQPLAMVELPDDIKDADQPNLCMSMLALCICVNHHIFVFILWYFRCGVGGSNGLVRRSRRFDAEFVV